jgi:hypothetical protein
MDASTYTSDNLLNAIFRGVAFPLPAHTYVSLHVGVPGVTGANEVSTANWPAYVRKQAENGGAMGTGWTASADDGSGTTRQTKNTNALPYSANNGASPVVVTHFGVWDAATGGNYIVGHALVTPVQIDPLEVFVFDVNTLTAKHG